MKHEIEDLPFPNEAGFIKYRLPKFTTHGVKFFAAGTEVTLTTQPDGTREFTTEIPKFKPEGLGLGKMFITWTVVLGTFFTLVSGTYNLGVNKGWWYDADTRYRLKQLEEVWDAEATLAQKRHELYNNR